MTYECILFGGIQVPLKYLREAYWLLVRSTVSDWLQAHMDWGRIINPSTQSFNSPVEQETMES